MWNTPKNQRRLSTRLRDYDYSQAGAYFITICSRDRRCLFGNIADGEVELSPSGTIVRETWDVLPVHYPQIILDEFIVMPNHVHGIIMILHEVDMNVGAGFKPAPTRQQGLPEIVRGFKTFSSRRINRLRRSPGIPVWQRSYYDHIIRNQVDLDRVRQYILDNPAKWSEDRENPQNIKPNATNPF